MPDILVLYETKTLQRRLQKRTTREDHPDFDIFFATKEAMAKIAQDKYTATGPLG